MRTRDEQKKDALFKATIKMVNEIGFAASSVSKIAKTAGVSPSTLYVFFQNKEDLLVCTYVEIKDRLFHSVMEEFNPDLPIRDVVKGVWFKTYDHIRTHADEFDYMEQFANSPFSALVDRQALEEKWRPIREVIQRGIEQKIIKNADMEILAAYLFYPVYRLANFRVCSGEMDDQSLELAFDMAWDAVRF